MTSSKLMMILAVKLDGDGNITATVRFPESLTADIEGENDHESMGTLTVYNGRLSDADEMVTLSVKGTTSTVDDAEAELVTLGTDPQNSTGTDQVTVSVEAPIIYATRTVTVKATVSEDASYTVKIGTESFAVDEDDGATVELPLLRHRRCSGSCRNEPAEHDRH